MPDIDLISRDTDPVSRTRRTRRALRDIELHVSRKPCPTCRQRAWLSGGIGCSCITSSDHLVARCLALAGRSDHPTITQE